MIVWPSINWSTLASRAEGKAFANSLGNSMLVNPKQLLARDDQRVPVHCNIARIRETKVMLSRPMLPAKITVETLHNPYTL